MHLLKNEHKWAMTKKLDVFQQVRWQTYVDTHALHIWGCLCSHPLLIVHQSLTDLELFWNKGSLGSNHEDSKKMMYNRFSCHDQDLRSRRPCTCTTMSANNLCYDKKVRWFSKSWMANIRGCLRFIFGVAPLQPSLVHYPPIPKWSWTVRK